jgi:D-arabinose 1-dehydrogenase-like Zn-dependent alcohol dehydrogenase
MSRQACVCVERGENFKVELREDYPVPEPGPDDILIKLNMTGLCQSDIHQYVKLQLSEIKLTWFAA